MNMETGTTPILTWEDFEKVEMRTGTIVAAEVFAQAKKPAYKLTIDFGPAVGTRQSSAQITKQYEPGKLIGQQVIAVINFPRKQIANFFSECLVLGAVEGDVVTLLQPERTVANGLRIL